MMIPCFFSSAPLCAALSKGARALGLALALTGAAAAWPAPLAAQALDNQALLDRLDRLERDIRTLNQQLARAATGGAGAVAPSAAAPQMDVTVSDDALTRVLTRLNTLEGEVRAATGQAESVEYRFQQLNERLDKLSADLEYRLTRLEGGQPSQPGSQPGPMSGEAPAPGAAPTAPGGVLGEMPKQKLDAVMHAPSAAPAPAAPAAAPASALPAGTPKEQYDYAFDLTRQSRYDEAEGAFKAFLKANPKDPLAENARYWLAETYYVRKSYQASAQAFFEAYQAAPKGGKAADSLLKLGMSMANLDKAKEACATFAKLNKEFPDLKANAKQAVERESKRLKCP